MTPELSGPGSAAGGTAKPKRSALLITPMAEAGGSDQALLRMVGQLTAAGFHCHVVVPAVSPLEAHFRRVGASMSIVPMRRITTSGGLWWWARYAVEWPLAVARLVRLARRLDVDVISTNSLHSWYGWAVAGLVRRPHVWHAREIVVQSQTALRLERLLVARSAAALVACSHAVADQFPSKVDEGRIQVVHEDVDRSVFRPPSVGESRERLLASSERLVGFVGRVDTWKGLDVLLDAWPTVRQVEPGARLVIAGPPVASKQRYYEAMQDRAAHLQGVSWLGPLDPTRTAELFRGLDVFAAPSTLPEPYGLVLVEALASGSRVVASSIGGAPEIIARAEPGAGALVDPGDPESLAEAIVRHLAAARTDTRRARIPPFPFDWATLYNKIIEADLMRR